MGQKLVCAHGETSLITSCAARAIPVAASPKSPSRGRPTKRETTSAPGMTDAREVPPPPPTEGPSAAGTTMFGKVGGGASGVAVDKHIDLPKRAGFGRAGRKIDLVANHFRMNIASVPELTLYDVQITPPASKRSGPPSSGPQRQQVERPLPQRLCRYVHQPSHTRGLTR